MYSLYFKPFPKILAEGLILRLNKFCDIKDIYEIYKDKEVCKYSDITPYTSISDAFIYYKNNIKNYFNNKCYSFVVEDVTLKKVVGTITITQASYNYKILQIGYSFNKSFHKKGYATKALTAFLDFCFNTLKAKRVEALVIPENEASIKLLQRLGFTNEATLKNGAILRENAVDVYMFSLIK